MKKIKKVKISTALKLLKAQNLILELLSFVDPSKHVSVITSTDGDALRVAAKRADQKDELISRASAFLTQKEI